MANSATSIFIDTREHSLHYMVKNGPSLTHDTKPYSSRNFDKEFYDQYILAVQEFMKIHTPAQSAYTTIVLPDSLIFTDTIPFPNMKGSSIKTTIESNLSGLLPNRSELRIQTNNAMTNKQFTVVTVTGVRDAIISDLKAGTTAARFVAGNFTFAAEATALAAVSLNNKVKSGAALLFDIKETFTRVVYLYKGEAVGFFSLPFGFSILEPTKIAAEDMLFDHSTAELAVLNARERAKAKALTVMDAGAMDVSDLDSDEDDAEATKIGTEDDKKSDDDEDEDEGLSDLFSAKDEKPQKAAEVFVKVLPKKVARKLPKFMQRPTPTTEDGFLYENFRIFEKWALEFASGNERLATLGKPDNVFVNMPSEFYPILDVVNKKAKENGLKFHPLSTSQKDENMLRHLESYGGLLVARAKTHNVFH